jgi:hypothetical protein
MLSGNKFCGEDNSGIYFELYGVQDTGTFILNDYQKAGFSGPERDSMRSLLLFSTTDTYTGKIVITQLDTQLHEVSGHFQFEAYNKEQNKIRRISEGFFNKISFYKY